MKLYSPQIIERSWLIIDKSHTQVQPDMEELTENAEEPDEGESKVSEVKLGKLQYKVISYIIYNFIRQIYRRLSASVHTNFHSFFSYNFPYFSSNTISTPTVYQWLWSKLKNSRLLTWVEHQIRTWKFTYSPTKRRSSRRKCIAKHWVQYSTKHLYSKYV